MRTRVRACLALVLLSACDPRVEEPLPPPKPPAPLTQPSAPAGPALSAATAGASTEKAAEPPPEKSAAAEIKRCIKPTPKTAERKVTGPVPDPHCPKDPETPGPLRTGEVVFTDAQNQSVKVEVTETENDHRRGLMYRRSMPENQGMIFAFEQRENHQFWMHNTCIPLDMLYIDGDGTIVGIEENAPTMNDSTFAVGCPSNYVLELNAGWTRKHGVVAGQKVKLVGI